MKLKNVISEIISFVFFSVIRCFRYSYLVVCTKHIRCFYKFTTVVKINYCATSKNSCLQNICSIDGLEDRYMYWDQKEAICFASVSTSRVHPFLLTENHRQSLVICILYCINNILIDLFYARMFSIQQIWSS